jgi:hypothetical protein
LSVIQPLQLHYSGSPKFVILYVIIIITDFCTDRCLGKVQNVSLKPIDNLIQ